MSEDFPVLAGFRAGSLVAGYRLEAQVGAGGMAVVFRARDERLGRHVALKLLTPALAADAAFRRRFIAESRAAATVDDPHIIPVYEAGEADGVLFIAMRFVRGGDLRLVLEREGVLPAGRVAGFVSPVASALDAAHRAGLVHRDVKPANILVDARQDRPDHVYLSDFGVSKGAISSVSLTGAGNFLGTPDYSAPEQIQGGAVDGRTDQYALACVAYELLAGATPFERDQGMAVLLAHLSQPPPSVISRRPDLPSAADEVLARGMAKAPEKRYGSCRDFAEALREALGLAPYHSLGSAAALDRPPSKTAAPPQPGRSGSAAAGKVAVAADPVAAVTIDSLPVRGPGPAPGIPASGIVTGLARPAADDGAEAVAEQGIPAAVRPASWPASRPTGEPETPSEQDRPTAELDKPAADAGGPASAPDALTAGPARAIRPEPGSHRAQPARHLRRRTVIASLAVLLVVIVGGGYLGWQWSQGQYYVGADSQGEVVIYRGVNQQVAGISLSKPYQLTGIELAQVPSPYQQTVKATDAASSLGNAQAIVANVRAAVDTCRQQYTALGDWVTKENAYLAAVAQARQEHKPANGIPGPGPRPPKAGATCPPPAAFGIAASAVTPPGTQ